MFRKTVFVLLVSIATAAFAGDELEPCINGDVSATGNFPSQEMENQIHAYLAWQQAEPYYLFKVAAREIPSTYPEN
jgi:hypothetical protein